MLAMRKRRLRTGALLPQCVVWWLKMGCKVVRRRSRWKELLRDGMRDRGGNKRLRIELGLVPNRMSEVGQWEKESSEGGAGEGEGYSVQVAF